MKQYILRAITKKVYGEGETDTILQIKAKSASELAKTIENLANNSVNLRGFTIEIVDTSKKVRKDDD